MLLGQLRDILRRPYSDPLAEYSEQVVRGKQHFSLIWCFLFGSFIVCFFLYF